ncbi:MAG TPA: TIGR02266 family protein [Polyangiaceae bacterium]|jgi:uncharacterized protein (TIGR02266 family)|nr:TIGR02266 family protein [Polyangiaceae bacterium]
MIQDTRKDPRAKVLSMTVRYKSATLDEFIEHHSHDVSRGGMYIKTPSPFPPGTLLKFEVRIADEQRVMQGVGRVVWKRETVSAGPETPAGMGVKFIKLDDESKKVIDQLVTSRGERDGAFDHGDRPPVAANPQSASAAPEQRQIPIRKGTMIGLGAMKAAETPAPGGAAPFFPEGPPAVQPAPEDQTVMRQAAELLRDALREAGGSIDEVMGPAATAPVSEKPASTKPAPTSNSPVQATESPAESRRPSPVAPAPSSRSPAPRASVRPPVSRPPYSSAPPPAKKSGGSAVGMVLGVAAVGGLIFYFAQRGKPAEEPTPAATTSAMPVAASAAPSAEATPPATSASAEASAEPAPSASAAPEETPAQKAARLKAEADAEKQAAADAKKAAADAKKAAADEAKKAADEERKAAADAKKAAADEARRPAALVAAAHPAPKPAAPKPAPTPVAQQAPAEAPAAPTSAPAEKPDTPPVAAAPTSAPAEKPAAPVTVEKPAPAPQPTPPKTTPKKSDDSDNPY